MTGCYDETSQSSATDEADHLLTLHVMKAARVWVKGFQITQIARRSNGAGTKLANAMP
jgi:hypothetical protein